MTRNLNKTKLRNLVQYKDMTDDEFNEAFEKLLDPRKEELEATINEKLEEYSKEYDLDDLKINDRDTLRALILATVSLEELELQSVDLRRRAADNDTIIISLDRLQRIMSGLRADISKLQDDLKITRKVRKGDKEASTIEFIENLKRKAHAFSKQTMGYVYCPKCRNLVATVWVQNTERKGNRIKVTCDRVLTDDEMEREVCGEVIDINIRDLYENGGANVDDIPLTLKSGVSEE